MAQHKGYCRRWQVRNMLRHVNRIDAQGGSGIQTVTDLHQLLKMHAPQAKVLAASFKTRVRRWTAYWQDVNQLLCRWMWHNR